RDALRLDGDDGVVALPAEADPLLAGLLRVAARYGEILGRCIDAAPRWHIEAFANDLGVRRLPPSAAHGYLVVEPAPGPAKIRRVVSARSRVAAPPAPGDPVPVVFETTTDVELVRARIVQAVLVDAGHVRRTSAPVRLSMDASPPATPPAWSDVP